MKASDVTRLPGFHWLSAMWSPQLAEIGDYAAAISHHGGKMMELVPPGLNPFPAEQLAETLIHNGIKDVSFTCFFPSNESSGNPIGNDVSFDKALDTVRTHALYMKALIDGGLNVHTYTGPSGWPLGHGRATFPLERLCEYYRMVLMIFERAGISVPIAIEFLREFEDGVMGPQNLNTLLTTLYTDHGVDPTKIGAHLDWYHCVERGLDLIKVVSDFGERILHVHAHGSQRLFPGMFLDGYYDTVNHEQIVKALNAVNYNGPIVFEQFCELVPNELRAGLPPAEKTSTFVRECMEAGRRYGYFF
jgi:sugar phosphate isomerase/epimerase